MVVFRSESSERFIGSRNPFSYRPNTSDARSSIKNLALTNYRKLMQYISNSTLQISDLDQAFAKTLTACCC
jgi:hypothetical protein